MIYGFKILSWNVRDLGNRDKQVTVGKCIASARPDVICLQVLLRLASVLLLLACVLLMESVLLVLTHKFPLK